MALKKKSEKLYKQLLSCLLFSDVPTIIFEHPNNHLM